jgi:hypothetical protein
MWAADSRSAQHVAALATLEHIYVSIAAGVVKKGDGGWWQSG